jgi:hypothetical protein
MATNDPLGDFRPRRGSLFDEFFADFFDRPFGMERAMSPTGTRTSAAPARRPVEQVDITEFFSDATRELLQRAARLALDWGSLDLDTGRIAPTLGAAGVIGSSPIVGFNQKGPAHAGLLRFSHRCGAKISGDAVTSTAASAHRFGDSVTGSTLDIETAAWRRAR